jgi:hypothetical protein
VRVKARDEQEMIRPTWTSAKPTSRPSGASRVKVIDWPTPVASTLNMTSWVAKLEEVVFCGSVIVIAVDISTCKP